MTQHLYFIPEELRSDDRETAIYGVYQLICQLTAYASQYIPADENDLFTNRCLADSCAECLDFSDEENVDIFEQGYEMWVSKQCNLAIAQLNES